MRKVLSFMMALLMVAGLAGTMQNQGAARQATSSPVEIIGSTGDAVAEITVDSISDPFEGFDEGYEPDSGFHYVVITLTINNVGTTDFYPQLYGINLVDTDGFRTQQGYVSIAEGAAAPILQDENIPPGERVTGSIAFEFLDGAEIAAIFYAPSYDRAYLLASNIGPVEEGTATALVSEDGNEIGTFTLNAVTDPLTDFDPSYQSPRGYHYVGFEVTIENTGRRPLSLNPSAFVLIDSQGYTNTSYGVYRSDEVEVPNLEYVDIAPGERVTGILSYTMFDDAEPAFLIHTDNYLIFQMLATFDGAISPPAISDIPVAAPSTPTADQTPGADATEEVTAVATEELAVEDAAGCVDAIGWLDRFQTRLESVDDMTGEIESVEDLEALDDATINAQIDVIQDFVDEQSEDPAPDLAIDMETAVIDLLNLQIDSLNNVLDARDNGDDLEPIFDEYDLASSAFADDYIEAISTFVKVCPSALDS